MMLSINSIIPSHNCKYRLDQQIAPSCYSGTAILSGPHGEFEAKDGILIIANQDFINSFKQDQDNEIIEILTYQSETIIIAADTPECTHYIIQHFQQYHDSVSTYGETKYSGATLNGRPHGYGKMVYGDGKIYEGNFVDGLRDGQGKLTMPSGEYFVGLFFRDSITEEGTYYDEHGNVRDISNDVSIWTKIWNKTWRLLASIACFLLAAGMVWLVVDFLSSDKGGRIKVGAFIVPLILGWYGLKYLIEFFKYLFTKESD